MSRVEKTGGSYPTETIYFQGKPIALLNATSGAWTDLIWAGGGLIAEVAGTQTALPSYRLLDHEGSLAMTTDGSGNVTGTNNLSPYGETLSSNTSDSFSYAGLTQDTEYGGHAATFRNYSTEQVRWTRPDPYDGSYDLANPQTMNRYVYAMNNPLNNIDASGLDPTDESGNDDGGGDDIPVTIFTIFGQTPNGTYILEPEGTPDNYIPDPDLLTPSLSDNQQWVGVTDASLGYINLGGPNSQYAQFLLSEEGWLPSGGAPTGTTIFNCPGCAQIWHNADVTVHATAIATAGVAAVPFVAPAAASVAPTALTATQNLLLNPLTWTTVGDFASGATPASLYPPTYAAAAGAVGSWLWDRRHR